MTIFYEHIKNFIMYIGIWHLATFIKVCVQIQLYVVYNNIMGNTSINVQMLQKYLFVAKQLISGRKLPQIICDANNEQWDLALARGLNNNELEYIFLPKVGYLLVGACPRISAILYRLINVRIVN